MPQITALIILIALITIFADELNTHKKRCNNPAAVQKHVNEFNAYMQKLKDIQEKNHIELWFCSFSDNTDIDQIRKFRYYICKKFVILKGTDIHSDFLSNIFLCERIFSPTVDPGVLLLPDLTL